MGALMRAHDWRSSPLGPPEHWPQPLRTAIRLGEIPATVDPVARAKGLVATSQGLMVVGKANPDEEVLRVIVDNAFTGLS